MSVELDEIIHAPKRLAICAMLSTAAALEFGTIRDELGVSDSVASKHLKVLGDAGYISTETKADPGSRRPRHWISLTSAGRAAFRSYTATLQRLLASGR